MARSEERNDTALQQLDGDITATQHALNQIGQADTAAAQAQRTQLEHTLGRLQSARTAAEQRATHQDQTPSRASEETT